MADYMSMARKITAALVYIPAPNEINTPFGPWQGWAYGVAERLDNAKKKNNPNILQQIAGWITKDLGRKVDGVTTTAIIVASQVKSTIFDGARGMLGIFTQPRPIIRDLKKLYEIDVKLGEKIDELGLEWHYFEPLQTNVYNQVIDILKSHQGWNSLLQEYEVKKWATYANIVSLLLSLNEKHKAFLAVWWANRFGNDDELKSITRWKVLITINPDYWYRIKEEYRGARRLICDKTWKQFKDSINNIGETFAWGVWNEVQVMKDAVNRLANATLKTDLKKATKAQKEYLQRERELLKTLYGLDVEDRLTDDLWDINQAEADLDTNSIDVKWWFGLAPLWRTLAAKQAKSKEQILADKQLRDQQREQRKAARKEKKGFIAFQKQVELRDRVIEKIKIDNTLRWNKPKTLFFAIEQWDLIEDMSDTSDAVLGLHEQTITLLYATQPTDLTDEIYNILQEVRTAQNFIKGQDSDNDIINHLWNACEAQCSNAWWKCRDS